MIKILAEDYLDGNDVGILKSWYVNEGDEVKKGDSIAKIQFSLEISDIEAPTNGILSNIKAQEGNSFDKSDVLAVIQPIFESSASLSNNDNSNMKVGKYNSVSMIDNAVNNSDSDEMTDLGIAIIQSKKLLDNLQDILNKVESLSIDCNTRNKSDVKCDTNVIKNDLNAIFKDVKESEDKAKEAAEQSLSSAQTSITDAKNKLEKARTQINKLTEESKDICNQRLDDYRHDSEKVSNWLNEAISFSRNIDVIFEQQESSEELTNIKDEAKHIVAEISVHQQGLIEFTEQYEKDLKQNKELFEQLYQRIKSVNNIIYETDKKVERLQNITSKEDTNSIKKEETDEVDDDFDFDKSSFSPKPSKQVDDEVIEKEIIDSKEEEEDEYLDDGEDVSTSESTNQHLRPLFEVDDYLKDDPCYAVILGLSGIGKSSGLEMILHTAVGGYMAGHNLDVEQTTMGQFNPISNLRDKNEDPINLVDVAGEDFLSWLIDNECHQLVEQIRRPEDNFNTQTQNVGYASSKQYFEKLITHANYLYIMLPSNDVEAQNQYSPYFTIDQCALAISTLLTEKYNKNGKVTFIINHVDMLSALKNYNDGHPYYYLDGTNFCPEEYPSNVEKTKNHLQKIADNLGSNDNNLKLMMNYVNLVHEEGEIDADNRNIYEYRFNEDFNYKLNYLSKRMTSNNFHYRCLAILYPIHFFIQRKLNEISKHEVFVSNKGRVRTILTQQFGEKRYMQAVNELKDTINTAFAIDELTIPKLESDVSKLKSEIAEYDKVIDRIGQIITNRNEDIQDADELNLDKESLQQRMEESLALIDRLRNLV